MDIMLLVFLLAGGITLFYYLFRYLTKSNILVYGPSYFVEIRFVGPFKPYFKRFVKGALNVSKVRTQKKIYPHITLIAPFRSSDERAIIRSFEEACKKTGKDMRVSVGGAGVFPENKVVFINATLSQNLLELQEDLYDRLRKISSLSKFDNPSDYHPHLTIWYRMSPYQYQRMKNYVFSRKKLPGYTGNQIRVTLLKKGRILREYGVQNGKMMNRKQALGIGKRKRI